MLEWISLPTDQFWRHALAVVPLVILVGGITRFVPCRPATRHTLWLAVLVWLVAAPIFPDSPSFSSADTATSARAVAEVAPDPKEVQSPASVESVPSPVSRDYLTALFSSESQIASEFVPPYLRRSVARPPEGSRLPGRLAQATDSGGPLPPPAKLQVPDDRHADLLPKPSTGEVVPQIVEVPNCYGCGSIPRLPADQDTQKLASADGAPAHVTHRPVVGEWLEGMIAIRDAVGELPPLPGDVWALGALFLLLLGIVRVIGFRRRVRRAAPAPLNVRRIVREAAEAYGLRHVPDILITDDRLSPMIWCGRRARLILPSGLWSELDDAGRRAVVFHELAHVRRRDHWVSWIENVIGILYWWHPLVWWVRSRVRNEAENCCDAWVTSFFPRGRRAYAEALLKTKEYVRDDLVSMPSMGIGMTSGRAGRFARRITMVMTKNSKPRLSLSGLALVVVVAGAGWVATPARSCPPGEKGEKAQRVIRKIKKMVTDTCEKCKQGKECKKCKVVSVGIGKDGGCGEAHKHKHAHSHGIASSGCGSSDCCKKIGIIKGCDLCKEGEPCPDCLLYAVEANRDGKTTFETYLAAKKTGYAPLVAQALGGVLGSVVLAGNDADDDDDADEDQDARIRRLEKRLEHLTRLLESKGEAPGPHPPAHAAPAPRRAPHEMRPPRAPKAPRAPRAARVPRAPRPDRPGALRQFFGPEGDGGEVLKRKYNLPEGKLKALTELMVRSDVPVLVKPLPDGIEVHGTPRQHRIFSAFVRLIDPRNHDDDHSMLWSDDDTGALQFALQAYAEAGSREEPYSTSTPPERRDYELLMAESAAQQEDYEIRRSRGEDLEVECRILTEQAEQIRAEALAVQHRAEELREQAEERRNESERILAESEKAIQRAEREDDRSIIDELRDKATAMAEHARAMGAESRNIDREAERVLHESGRLERRAEEVDRKVQRIRAKLESVEEKHLQHQQQLEQLRQKSEEAPARDKEDL